MSIFSTIVLGPFVYFSITPTPWRTMGGISVAVNSIYFSLEQVIHDTRLSILNAVDKYFFLLDAKKENVILKAELNTLHQKLISYDEDQRELVRLRKLLDFNHRSPLSLVAVEILSGNTLGGPEPFRTLRISKGSLRDLEPGMPVLTERGLLGRLLRTGFNFSDVQVLVDPNFNVDVLLEHSRVRTILYGYNNSLCQMQLPRGNEARIGDSIITSGLVGTFPKGIKIGEIVSISYDMDQVHQNILVQPYVNIREVEEAFVVFKKDELLKDITAFKEYKNDHSPKTN